MIDFIRSSDPSDYPPFPEELYGGSHVLAKAASDHWTYLVETRTGRIFICDEIDQRGDWVLLVGARPYGWDIPDADFYWGRGVEVRAADIVWVADCDS